MNSENDIAVLQKYIERTKWILELSSPQLDGIEDAEQYRRILAESFTRIGELAEENNAALAESFYPLLDPTHQLTKENIGTLRFFSSALIDTTSMENLDLPLIYIQAERILDEAEKSGDLRSVILALDGMVISAYMMLNLTIRLYPQVDICFYYRDIGWKAANRLLEYLKPEIFASLPDDECKALVLVNARYIRTMFEWGDKKNMEPYNENDLRLMEQALALAEDPFYRKEAPNYNWDMHVFRTLQYISDFTEDNNSHHFSGKQLERIADYTYRLIDFMKAHPEFEYGCPPIEQEMYRLRNDYLTGRMDLETYRRELLRIKDERDDSDFTARSMFVNFTVPFEYILTLEGCALTKEQEGIVSGIYADMIRYAYHMPKTGVLSFMLTFLALVMRHFIEVPGGMRFSDFCQELLAAMHPPTYVHTLSVASFTAYLTGKMIDRAPERFVGVLNTASPEEVTARREEIVRKAYEGALLHDIGKLFIMETIITYGRKLPEEEFRLIRSHPTVGAALLSKYSETADFADAALGHHKWYDNLHGYPEDFDLHAAKNRTLIEILMVADCLDAATDTIGRSYKQGRTLDECIAEIRAESGTRYAPYLAELLEDEEVHRDLESLLTTGREENYRKAFETLKNL